MMTPAYDPIFITSIARSGTSLIANLLHAHGVWIGEAKESTAKPIPGNVGTENIHIKRELKWYLKKLGHKKGRVISRKEQGAIDRDQFWMRLGPHIPLHEPWLVKTGALIHFCYVLNDLFPEARWLLPMRRKADILTSMQNHPIMARRKWDVKAYIELIQHRQRQIAFEFTFAKIYNPDDLISSEEKAKELLEFCDVDVFQVQEYRRIVDPNRWKKWA